MHRPVYRSHFPLLEHSATWCAESVDVAESDHAGPVGQVRSEQSAPVYPVKHVHVPQGELHLPLEEQEFGQGV